ncbi:MAG: hypothetical protein M0R17_05140 [Candidatus Omnitrophica bacterium]|jgi:hypothetical protein|nr:hypothetical protein [Candidatus Omnitrophota bacterium]
MTEIGMYFGRNNITLRSGGASGADMAFELGCATIKGPKQIFFPWRKFNGRDSYECNNMCLSDKLLNIKSATAYAIKVWSLRNMPVSWNSLKDTTKLMMIRNSFQIMGPLMNSPTDLVICYTPDGQASGGTGQAIAMADFITKSKKTDIIIPIINLQQEKHLSVIKEVLKGLDIQSFISTVKEGLYKQYKA